jgi:EAL domain-containing protein (putative c-di-GMP-specific phosphodiesterase class I)
MSGFNILQAIVDPQDLQSVIFYELLARPAGVTDIPGYFRGLHETGEIVDFDIVQLGKAIAFLEANPDFRISVNLSPQTVSSEKFETCLDMIRDAGSDIRERMIFELTEHFSEDMDISDIADKINHPKRFGSRTALDDYEMHGDPRSGLLAEEHQGHIHWVKLERKALDRALASPEIEEKLTAWIATQHAQGRHVVMEGIRDQDNILDAAEVAFCRKLGVDGMQVLPGTFRFGVDNIPQPYQYPIRGSSSPDTSCQIK